MEQSEQIPVDKHFAAAPWMWRKFNAAGRKAFDLRYENSHPVGGHFAPMEEPEVVINDIRETFRPLR